VVALVLAEQRRIPDVSVENQAGIMIYQVHDDGKILSKYHLGLRVVQVMVAATEQP
jgi:hypothetical protein